jgi:ABC-type bacteriocin/lantibiotic exporter with double-glycine peptidase domain
MNPVIQQEKTGCAIASAAAIAGVSYQQAKELANSLGIYAEDQSLWSSTRPIRSLLAALGYRLSQQKRDFINWQQLPECALLAIKWHLEDGQPFWHWVVYRRDVNKDYVLDSNTSLNNPVRTDFGRMKPKWFKVYL